MRASGRSGRGTNTWYLPDAPIVMLLESKRWHIHAHIMEETQCSIVMDTEIVLKTSMTHTYRSSRFARFNANKLKRG